MIRKLLFLFVSFAVFSATFAEKFPQRPLRRTNNPPTDSTTLIGRVYQTRLADLVRQCRRDSTALEHVLENPYLFPLFGAPALYNFPIHREFALTAEDSATVSSWVSQTLLHTYAHHPELILHNLTLLPTVLPPRKEHAKEQPTKPSTALLPPIAPPVPSTTFQAPNANDLEITVHKPNFWTFVGNFSFQFMQYYVSDNWYKGGEKHNSFLAATNLEANYDNKEGLVFNNKLEMRLGFQSSNSDTRHRYKTNTDLLRLTNKLGRQATKNWYYTVMLQSWTQFSPGYKSNDPKVYSDIFSPLEAVLSVGMDYKLNRRAFNLTTTLSPLAVNAKYVDRLALSPRYGLDAGHHTKFNFGSSITVNVKWQLMKDVEWVSRLFAFTNYSRVQAEWENTFNFKVNRYLSAKLFLYPRFDDGVRRVKDQSYFQFNEFLSLGLDYTF